MDNDQRVSNLLKETIAGLSEHFDSVVIVGTIHENNRTIKVSHASGNWYANYGALSEYVSEMKSFSGPC